MTDRVPASVIGAPDHPPAPSGRHRYPGRYATEAPERAAMVYPTTGAVQTYEQLDRQARKLSGLLRDRGAMPGDHVVLLVENHPRFLEVVWGCHYAGLVYTPCSTKLTRPEVAYVVNNSGARTLIVSGANGAVATAIVEDTPHVTLRLAFDGDVAGHERYEALTEARELGTEPPGRVAGADMLYSSGTTGRPKGVARAFRRRPLETAPVGTSYAARKYFGVDEDTVYLATSPLYHGAGGRFCMAVTALGGTVILLDRFDVESALGAIERHRVTHTQMVPTMLQRILAAEAAEQRRWDISSLRFLIHSAAPITTRLKEAVIRWAGPVVYEYYAGTESNGLVMCDTEEWLAHKGTVGRPRDCRLHICDPSGQEVPSGQVGTIFFESDAEFSYHGDPAKTAASRHSRAPGWSTLGDAGFVDEEGFLYLTDRQDFMIITGGVNVYPRETEERLLLHPAVRDVAVFGIPDDVFGERVVAVVEPSSILSPIQAGSLVTELAEHCAAGISKLKCPKEIRLVTTLHRDDAGKLKKRQLQTEWVAQR